MTERVYQCVMRDDLWHLTQEQAVPPPIHLGGAYIICDSLWAAFARGYEKRRPTCAKCLEIVRSHEEKSSRGT